jgi:uncharacterized membrane protein
MKKLNDKDMALLIGTLLRWGVLLSMSIVILGGVVYLLRHGHDVTDYSTFKGEPDFTRKVNTILDGVIALKGKAIIQLGIILLIATPVSRVLLSAISFAAEKDYLYVGIASIVLIIIAVSILGGFGG